MENERGNGVCPRLSEETETALQGFIERYPSKKSVIMPALYLAQNELGWLTDEAVRWVGARLDLPHAHVMQVATFYTMYYKRPVGQYHVQVCRTLSCEIRGAQDLVAHLRARLGLQSGEISEDGLWSYEEVECLGSCGSAPMVEINDVYFENLSVETLDGLMDRIEAEKPDLRFWQKKMDLAQGFTDLPKSEVW